MEFGSSGLMPRPSKMSGNEMIRMELFRNAASMPTVVTTRATRRSRRSASITTKSLHSLVRLTIQTERRNVAFNTLVW